MKSLIRAAMVGCGGMAQYHLQNILCQQNTTKIVALCDPNPAALGQSREKFREAGLAAPPTWASLERMLAEMSGQLDAVFIITPHAFHRDQAIACMEAGLDVLLEKPMAMNATEAQQLIEARNRTGRLLVVAFQGSLSPEIRTAVTMLRAGQLGQILNIHAVAWQGWREMTVGTWRQNLLLSGGGFMFDTGAHLLNTVADLAGEPFVEVAAWFDRRDTPVDILAAAIGRLKSGALVTLNGCGDTIDTCESDIRVFCTGGVLQTGMWGGFLRVQRPGRKRMYRVKCSPSLGSWQQFVAVRSGQMANPCPPEIGLRMIQLWDALRESAGQGGRPIPC